MTRTAHLRRRRSAPDRGAAALCRAGARADQHLVAHGDGVRPHPLHAPGSPRGSAAGSIGSSTAELTELLLGQEQTLDAVNVGGGRALAVDQSPAEASEHLVENSVASRSPRYGVAGRLETEWGCCCADAAVADEQQRPWPAAAAAAADGAAGVTVGS